MINIQPVTDAYMYTIGTWTSQILYNAKCKFPTGTSTEWGYLSWAESNTGSGYTGFVRIDILDSSDVVLISDIAKNVDGTPTDISTSVASVSDIKIRVKLYGLDTPTPEVTNIWVNYKNWTQTNVITNNGKNVLLNRSFLSAPTTNYISQMRYGNGEVSNFSESSTGLTNGVGVWASPDTVTYDTTNNTVSLAYEVTNGTGVINNGITLSAIGFQNQDASPLLCAASTFSDIVKDPAYYYKITGVFRIITAPTNRYMMTSAGRNLFLDRTFKSVPTYTAPTKFVLGYTGTLLDGMTALDSEIVGPTTFTYTLFDTVTNKLLVRGGMDSATGNGSTFNAICHKNTDGSPILTYTAKMYENILKTSNYIYQFDTNYRAVSPTSLIG